MAETSAYLTRLNLLKEQIHWNNRSLPEMSERMRLLSILLHIQDTIEFFEKEIIKAGESIPLHVDAGVDYLKWCNPQWIIGDAWMKSETEIVKEHQNQAWNANSESHINEKTTNELSGYLPKSIRPEYVDSIGRKRFGEALQLLSGPYFNIANLELAIYAAAKNLADILQELKKAIDEERLPQEYMGMLSRLWIGFHTTEVARTIRMQYENDKQESSEKITVEWLNNRRDEALQEFKNTSFFLTKKRDTGNDANRAAKRIYTIKNDFIEFDQDAEVGKFIHKRHMDRAQINEFFAFRKKVELIQADMLELREEVEDIFPEGKDFSNTVFEKNHDARAIYNELYQLVNEQKLFEAKKVWYVVYLVFKHKNWLKNKTGKAFAQSICTMYDGIVSADVWKPNAADFKEVDSYYKRHSFEEWNKSDPDAPNTCEEYKRVADIVNKVFDRTYLL